MGPDLNSSLEVHAEQGEVLDAGVTAPLLSSDLFNKRTSLWRKRQFVWTILSITLSVLFLVVVVIIFVQTQKQRNEDKGSLKSITSIPLENADFSSLGQIGQLDVNGVMRVNGGLVLQPTDPPANAQTGQLYFDDKLDRILYYDGATYKTLSTTDGSVSGINGQTGNITLGDGLLLTDGRLSSVPSALGVTTIQGQSGSVTLTAGSGITINGTNISNGGVLTIAGQRGAFTIGRGMDVANGVIASDVSLISGSANLIISDDGDGHYTISDTGSGASGNVSLGPVAAQVDASNNVAISINKTGTGDFLRLASNGTDRFAIDQTGNITLGTIPYSQVTGAPSSVVAALTNGVTTATGTITIGGGLTLVGNTLSASGAGVSAVNGTTNQVNSSTLAGVVTLSLPQNIHSGATPTFAGVNTNAITPSAALSVGISTQSLSLQGSTITFNNNGATYNFGSSSSGAYTICTTEGNCVGTGGGVTTTGGAANTLAKFTGAQAIGNSIITDNGTLVTIGGNLNVTGALTLGTALPVGQGGTGAASFTTNGVILGNGTGALASTAAPSAGQILLANGSSVPQFTTLSGDLLLSSAGIAAIQADSVVLGTDTTGAYVASLGTLTGLTTTGNSGEGSTPTLAVTYGSTANTAVQGNTSISVSPGTNLTGGGSVTLGAGGTVTLNVANSPTFSGNAVVQGGTITIGTTSQAATLELHDGTTQVGSFVTGNLTSNRTYTMPDASGTVCLDTGNCLGGTGGAPNAGSYITIGNDATLTGERSIAAGTNVSLTDGGANGNFTVGTVANPSFGTSVTTPLLQSSGALSITPSGALTVGATGQTAALQGSTVAITSNGAGNDITLTSGGDIRLSGFNCTTFTNGGVLTTDASGNIACANDDGGSAGAISGSGSSNRIALFTGSQTLADSWLLQNGSTLEIDNTRNLSLTGGNFSVTGTGTFSGLLSANGNFTIESGDTFTMNGDAFTDLTGTGLTISSGSLQTTLGTSVDLGAEITGTLPVANGGTGVNGSTAANGQLLIGNGTGYTLATLTQGAGMTITNASGGITVASAFGSSIDLGAETTGNYQAGTSAGNGIGVTGTPGAGWTAALALSALTADWNQTGAFDLVLNNANSELSVLESTGGTFFGSIDVGDLTADRTYTFPDASGTICLNTGNCAGSGSGVTTSGGTTDRVAKFTGSQALGDSSISDDGSVVTVNGSANLIIQGGTGTFGTTSQAGTITISDGSSNTVSIVASAFAGNQTYTLPDVGGAATFCMSTGNCVGGGGGGAPNAAAYLVASLDGTLTNERALNAGSNISLTDGGAGGNFTVATVQNPTFTTSVTTPLLQSSGALTITSASGQVLAVDAGTTIELQDSTNVTGSMDISVALNVGTGDAFQVNSSGAITAATGIISSGSIRFSGFNCTTFTNGGVLTTDASGNLTCANDDGGAAGTITGSGTSGKLPVFTAGNVIGDSIVTQSGTTITVAGDLTLSTALTVANGGTGAVSFTTNGIIYGNNTGALQVTAAGTSGQVLVANGSGIPTFVSFSGDVAVSATGATTIQPNSVALGTDTTGDYVTNLGTLTGLSTSGNSGEGSTPTLSVNYGSAANTAVQGNTTLTCPAGTGNLNGGGTSVTLGTGGTCAALDTVANPSFGTSVTTPSLQSSGALTITAAGAVSVGSTSQALTLQGNNVSLTSTNAGVTNSLVFATPASGNKTITIPNASGTLVVSASAPLSIDASGNLTCATCLTTGGTYVSSLNGLAGALSIANASGSGATITINDASTGQKGIAQFNSTNFSVASGVVNTIQDIATTSAPTFASLTTTGIVTPQGGILFPGDGFLQTKSSNQLPDTTGILLPLYDYPVDVYNNAVWNNVIALKKKYHSVPLTVIINPASGPGGFVDANYTAAIKRLHGAGITVLGYVDTSYAAIAQATVESDIDDWVSMYPEIDGMFVDQTTSDNNVSHFNYYDAITAYAHGKGLFPVIHNPGVNIDEGYFSNKTADIYLTHENATYPTEADLKGDVAGGNASYDYRSRSALVYNQGTFDYSQIKMMRQYVGSVYVTSGVMPNPWDTVPSYFESLFQALNNDGNLIVDTITSQGNIILADGTGQLQFDSDGEVYIREQGGADSDVMELFARAGYGFYTNTGQDVFGISQNGMTTAKASADAFGGLQVVQSNDNPVFRVETSGGEGVVTIGYTGDTDPTLLILDHDTDQTSDPAGTNGAMYYNNGLGKFRCYQGGSWVDCITTTGAAVTLQSAYDASTNPEIVFGAGASAGLSLRDNATPLAGNLFEIQNNAGTTTYMGVTTSAVTFGSNVDIALTGATAYISNAQGYANAESFGANATTDDRSVAFGTNADSNGTDAVAIGYNTQSYNMGVAIGSGASNGSTGSVSVGASSFSSYLAVAVGETSSAEQGGVAIGQSAVTGDHNGIAIGGDASTGTGHIGSIALGYGAATTAANQMVIGSNSAAINQIFAGNGVANATPSSFTLQATGGSGSNVAGASVTIAGGRGTGTGSGGDINLQIAAPGASGSTANTLTSVATISGVNGSALFKNAANSTSAFQIQNASSTPIINVDTVQDTTNNLADGAGVCGATPTCGGFENGVGNWALVDDGNNAGGGSPSVTTATSQFVWGARSMDMTFNSTGDKVRLPITLANGQYYTLNFYAKSDLAASGVLGAGYSQNGSTEDAGTLSISNQSVANTGWTHYVVSIAPTNVTGSPYIYFKQNSSTLRHIYIDNLVLAQVTAQTQQSTPAYRPASIALGGVISTSLIVAPSANSTALQVLDDNGATVLNVDTKNNFVGIGTMSPASKLHVASGGTSSTPTFSTLRVGATVADSTTGGSNTLNLFSLYNSALSANDLFTVSNGGNVTIAPYAGSSSAFQVQGPSGTDTMFSVNTTTRAVGTAGNVVKIGNSTGSDTALTVLQVDSATADPTTNLASLNGGLFYNSITNKLSIIENGQIKIICNTTDLGCGTGTVTLQSAYNNSSNPEIVLGAGVSAGLTLRDNATPLAGNLFEVQDNGGTATYVGLTTTALTFGTGIDLMMQGAGAYISNPQGQTNSESFGLGATVAGTNSVAFGNGANTHATGASTAIGYNASAGTSSVAVGSGAITQGNAVAIGQAANANSASIAIGQGASTGAFDDSIALGRGAEATATNQLVIGSSVSATSYINSVVIGDGVTSATPNAFTLQGTSGSGSNIAGASVTIAGGQSTGSANGGNINLQISTAGGAGASLNSLATVAAFSGANGSATFTNAVNSATAFQVQSASAAETLFTVDTAARSTSGGNLIRIGNATGTDGGLTLLKLDSVATAGVPSTGLASGILNGSLFYNSQTHKVNIIENGIVKALCNTTDNGCGAAGPSLAKDSGSSETSSSNFAGVMYNFTQSNSGAAGVLSLSNAGTNSALSVTSTANPSGNNALIYGQLTNASASGNLINLRSGASGSEANRFTITGQGAVLLNSAAGVSGATGSAASAALTINGGNGGNGSTGVGGTGSNISMTAGSGGTSNSATLAAGDGGAVSIQGGNGGNNTNLVGTGDAGDGGSINFTAGDGGNSDGGSGAPGIGGHITLQAGNSPGGTGGNVYLRPGTGGSPSSYGNVIIGVSDTNGQLLVLDTKTDATDPTGVAGGMYYNSGLGKFRCYESGAWSDCLGFSADQQRKMGFFSTDFYRNGTGDNPPWSGSGVGTGTLSVHGSDGLAVAEHPGIVVPTTVNATANTGYSLNTPSASITISGGETFEAVFKMTNPANTITRVGFCDTGGTTTDCADGAYIEINGTTLVATGKTANNNTRSSTGTTYSMSSNTWYRMKVTVNSNASLVTYYVYNDSGTQLWTNTLATNIPNTAGRSTGSTFTTYTTASAASVIILNLDYMSMWYETPLTR